MPAYETSRKILFQHCDPAGIVFYPRYFELLNAVVEEWFEDALGVSFAELHGPRNAGIPTVKLDSEFKGASRLGEVLSVRYGIASLGGASLTARFGFYGPDGDVRVSGTQVLVHVDLDGPKPTPWPDDLRAGLERYCIDEEE